MSEKKDKINVSIEDTLMRELRGGGIEKDRLKELVDTVAGIQKAGLKRLKAFPKGIPPIINGLRVSGVVEASDAPRFLGETITRTSLLSRAILFPLGIPWPEVFVVTFDIGPLIEDGKINQF